MITNETKRRPEVEALKKLAYSACQHTSFSPDKRGEMLMNDLETMLQDFLPQIPDEFKVEYQEKFISLYSNWLSAKSRCASTMITGPANFPTKRNEKRCNWEQSAWNKVVEWRDRVIKRLNKQQRLTGWAEIERLQEKVDNLTLLQSKCKEINSICRKKISDDEKIEILIGQGYCKSEATAKEFITPDRVHGVGIPSYSLTNNLAKIKNTQARLDKLTRAQNTETKEYEVGDVKVEEHYADNRIRLYFNGKPSEDTRTELKRNGFKWSPRAEAWQNYINCNSLRFVKGFLKIETT